MSEMTAIEKLYQTYSEMISVIDITTDGIKGFIKGYQDAQGNTIAVIISAFEKDLYDKNDAITESQKVSYNYIIEGFNKYYPNWRLLIGLAPKSNSIKYQSPLGNYKKTYTSFSGTDIVASITLPREVGGGIRVIGELQTISYSIHREVVPVVTLGRINAKGFTAGRRTIAGSLIFTVFNRNLVYEIQAMILEYINKNDPKNTKYGSTNGFNRKTDITSEFLLMDEMPPFDITISMGNEYGNEAYLVIKGIVIVDEGQVMSIEDMITENTMSFMATDIHVLKDIT